MTVIAMTREMGSLGKDVAAGVADQLGLEVIHHELVERDLAQRLGLEDSAVHRYLEGGASLLDRWKIDKQKLSRYTAEEILQLAQKGDVLIRGWGATALLENVPGVLCMRVCAPMAARERVMMQRLGLEDAGLARREIERNDAAHERVMREMFNRDWQNPTLYHLVLNTAQLPVEECVEITAQLARRPMFQVGDKGRIALADRLIEARVRAALREHFSGGSGVSSVDVAVANGRVTLSGMSLDKSLAEEASTLVRNFPGVTDVKNEIVAVRGIRANIRAG
jgi:cytidylate kinase